MTPIGMTAKEINCTCLITPWCRILLEKLTSLQLVKKFPAFHGTRRFITALTSVRHNKLSPEESSRMWVILNNFFYREGLLAPRPIPKLEDHPSSALRDYLFNLFAATLLIGGRSSIRNLRTRHAVVTETHYMTPTAMTVKVINCTYHRKREDDDKDVILSLGTCAVELWPVARLISNLGKRRKWVDIPAAPSVYRRRKYATTVLLNLQLFLDFFVWAD